MDKQTILKGSLGIIVYTSFDLMRVSAQTEMNVVPLPEYNRAQQYYEEDLHRLQVQMEGQK